MKFGNILNAMRGGRSKPTVADIIGPATTTLVGTGNFDADEAKAAGEFITHVERLRPRPALFIDPSILRHIHELGEGSTFTAADRAETDAIELEESRIDDALRQHLQGDVKTAYRKQQEDIAAKVRAGEPNAIPAEVYSIADFHEHYESVRRSLKAQRRDIREKMLPISLRIANRMVPIAVQCADEIEAHDKARATEWGIPYVPARLVIQLRQIADHPADLVNHTVGNSPRQTLIGLGIEI